MLTDFRQQYAYDDADDKKAHGVFRHHPKTDDAADGHPPAWILGLEQANYEIGGQHPEQIVERDILHQRAATEAGWDRRSRSGKLSPTASSKVTRHQARQQNRRGFGQSRE